MARFVVDEMTLTYPVWRMRIAQALMLPVALLWAHGFCDERWIDRMSKPLGAFVARGVKIRL